jgi:hypothetical protein
VADYIQSLPVAAAYFTASQGAAGQTCSLAESAMDSLKRAEFCSARPLPVQVTGSRITQSLCETFTCLRQKCHNVLVSECSRRRGKAGRIDNAVEFHVPVRHCSRQANDGIARGRETESSSAQSANRCRCFHGVTKPAARGSTSRRTLGK